MRNRLAAADVNVTTPALEASPNDDGLPRWPLEVLVPSARDMVRQAAGSEGSSDRASAVQAWPPVARRTPLLHAAT